MKSDKVIQKELIGSLRGYIIGILVINLMNLLQIFKTNSQTIYNSFNGIVFLNCFFAVIVITIMNIKISKLYKYGYSISDIFKNLFKTISIMHLIRIIVSIIAITISYLIEKEALISTDKIISIYIKSELLMIALINVMSLAISKMITYIVKTSMVIMYFFLVELWLMFFVILIFAVTIIEATKDFIWIYPVLMVIIAITTILMFKMNKKSYLEVLSND